MPSPGMAGGLGERAGGNEREAGRVWRDGVAGSPGPAVRAWLGRAGERVAAWACGRDRACQRERARVCGCARALGRVAYRHATSLSLALTCGPASAATRPAWPLAAARWRGRRPRWHRAEGSASLATWRGHGVSWPWRAAAACALSMACFFTLPAALARVAPLTVGLWGPPLAPFPCKAPAIVVHATAAAVAAASHGPFDPRPPAAMAWQPQPPHPP